MLVHGQLFAAGLPHPAGSNAGKVLLGEGVPILGQHIPLPQRPAAPAALQSRLQVGDGGGRPGLPGQLGAAEHHQPRARALGRKEVLRLGRKLLRQQRVHNGDDAAQPIPAVQRVVPQHIKKLVHIKNAAGLPQHPGKASHGHGDERGAHPALVGVAVAPAADGLQLGPLGQQVLHQHSVHIHRAEVVFEDAELLPLCQQIPGVPPQKRRLARPQKPCDEVYLYHTLFLPLCCQGQYSLNEIKKQPLRHLRRHLS